MNLCDINQVHELLEKYGLKPQKGFGQNFLINPEVPERIALSSIYECDSHRFFDERKGKNVLEIGPGLGTMTRELCYAYEKVVAVEIDRGMISVLQETLSDYDNVEVVEKDFMKLDLPVFLKEHFGEEKVKVCANLPYYITSPILMKLLEAYGPETSSQIESITILVQTEVANRLCAKSGTSDYGAITASVALCGTANKLFDVAAGNFYPAPKVVSSVVHISLYPDGFRNAFENMPDNIIEVETIYKTAKKLIAAGFNQRRKTFVNSASSIAPKDKMLLALDTLGFRSDIRAECLSAKDFINIAKELVK